MNILKRFHVSFSKVTSATVIVALLVLLVSPGIATAAALTTVTDTMSRLKASTLSDHTIKFVTPTGVAAGQTITITFAGGFTMGTFNVNNFDLATATTCGGSFTDKTLATSPSGATWGVGQSGQVVTITSGSDTISATNCVSIEIGANATSGAAGTTQITNPATATAGTGSPYAISLTAGPSDSGTLTVVAVDDDQVTVTATVNQSITFDLDTESGGSNGESNAPYSVPLGTLTSGSVTVSNSGAVRMIVAEGDTNAAGGMIVTVRNANGANGLVSTSVPADKIPNAAGTMSAGTANYGLCVASSGLTGFTRATAYNTTCALSSGTNTIPALTTTPADILNSGGAPVATGHAEIVVNATVSGLTPAHTDYTDTLTFIATGTF